MKLAVRLLACAGVLTLIVHPACALPVGSTPAPRSGATGTSAAGDDPRINVAVQSGGRVDAETVAVRPLSAVTNDTINALNGFGLKSTLGKGFDQTSGLQAWVAALNAKALVSGLLPCGDYAFSQTLIFTGSGEHVRGLGSNCTTLHYTGTGDAVRFSAVTQSNPTGSGGYNSWSDITLRRDTADGSTGIGLHVVNQTGFRYSHAPAYEFYRGVVTEGGTGNIFHDLISRSGDYYSTLQPGSISFDIQPFVDASGNHYAPESTYADNVDLGGVAKGGYFIEAGVRLGAADQANIKSGHIGSVLHDVELARRGDQSIASLEIGPSLFLDGSLHGVYAPAPASGTGKGGASAHIRIHPFQIDNQYGDGVDIEDPNFDGGIFGVDLADQGASAATTASAASATASVKVASASGITAGMTVIGTGVPTGDTVALSYTGGLTIPLSQAVNVAAGTALTFSAANTYSIYAPFAAKLDIIGNHIEGGNPNVGGIKVGLVIHPGRADTAGSVGALVELDNAFYGVHSCMANANLDEAIVRQNLTNDCTSGKQPAERFPGGLTTTGLTAQTAASTGYIDLLGGGSGSSDNAFPASWEWRRGDGTRWAYMGFRVNGGIGVIPDNGHSLTLGAAGLPTYLPGINIETLTTPASSSAACTAGQVTDDANYHYVCTATNTWKRVALSAF